MTVPVLIDTAADDGAAVVDAPGVGHRGARTVDGRVGLAPQRDEAEREQNGGERSGQMSEPPIMLPWKGCFGSVHGILLVTSAPTLRLERRAGPRGNPR